MMEILKHPDERLRQVCMPFLDIEINAGRFADPMFKDIVSFEDLGRDMLATCKAANGIGLAAPQVGVMRRFIVVCVPGWQLVIGNPEVTYRRHTSGMKEGCLSYPGRQVYVTRSRIIRVKGFDIQGEPITVKANGLLSTCLQHEIDHLDGVCQVGPKEIRDVARTDSIR